MRPLQRKSNSKMTMRKISQGAAGMVPGTGGSGGSARTSVTLKVADVLAVTDADTEGDTEGDAAVDDETLVDSLLVGDILGDSVEVGEMLADSALDACELVVAVGEVDIDIDTESEGRTLIEAAEEAEEVTEVETLAAGEVEADALPLYDPLPLRDAGEDRDALALTLTLATREGV